MVVRILTLLFVLGLMSACGTATPTAAPMTTSTPSGVPFRLYTHCGIDEAKIDDAYYEAVQPLEDGNGNPPDGWGNPFQEGTMTLLPPDRAIFTDPLGHRVVLGVRPHAEGFKRICS